MTNAPDKDAIRRELEATRRAYHDLLSSLSSDDWRRKSANPDLTIKEVMWHMAWALGWMAGSLDAVRRGRGIALPSFLIEPGRKFAMRWLARNATPAAAARKYDQGHAALLARLDTVGDDDWSLGAKRFGELRTVGWYFAHPKRHLDEHAADVRAALGRA